MNDGEQSLFTALRIDYCIRVMCGTKRLNPFFTLHEASEVLNKYVMGVWSYNFTTAFWLVSF